MPGDDELGKLVLNLYAGREQRGFLETCADERAWENTFTSLGTCRWLYIQRCGACLSLLGNYYSLGSDAGRQQG